MAIPIENNIIPQSPDMLRDLGRIQRAIAIIEEGKAMDINQLRCQEIALNTITGKMESIKQKLATQREELEAELSSKLGIY